VKALGIKWMVFAALLFLAGLAMAVWGVRSTVGCPGAPVQMPYTGGAPIIDCISGERAVIDRKYVDKGIWVAVGVASATGVVWAGRRRSSTRSYALSSN
jgi:hypothetical protein